MIMTTDDNDDDHNDNEDDDNDDDDDGDDDDGFQYFVNLYYSNYFSDFLNSNLAPFQQH
jgi:hypothetical protein